MDYSIVMCVTKKWLLVGSRSRQNNSTSHIREKKYGIVVKLYENIAPKIDEGDFIPDDVIKDCRDKFLIPLNTDVSMITNFQVLQIMKKLI